MSVDSPPTSETRNRRRLAMAAAAVVAVIGVAAIAINSMNSDDDVAPLSTAAPTVAATTVAPTTVAPTRKTVSFAVGSTNDISVTFTVPDDWTVIDGWSAYMDGVGGLTGVLFDDIANIYADGCQWVLVDPPPGPTVDDLVAAWADVPEFAATAAVDVTVDGHAGKQIEFSVPDYTPSECREDKYGLWDVRGTGDGETPGYWAQGPNHHFQIWVLDVAGTRLVITAGTFPSTSPQDRAALEEALASIQIG